MYLMFLERDSNVIFSLVGCDTNKRSFHLEDRFYAR
jgi:hypothetical protein